MKKEILDKITSLAKELSENDAQMIRADLAYELKDFGIKGDGQEVAWLIMDAFEATGNDLLREVFVCNDKTQSLVDQLSVAKALSDNNTQLCAKITTERLDESGKALATLDEISRNIATIAMAKDGPSQLNRLIGSYGVKKVSSEAQAYFNAYNILVNSYTEAKDDVKNVMADFVEIRTQVAEVYQKYATALIDIYGDRIKSVAPSLFDFDSLEFLDVSHMLDNIKLGYDQLLETCAMLIGDITSGFSQSMGNSLAAYKSAGSKEAGIVMAGMGMLSHYMNASEQTSRVKQELERLKMNMKHDTTLIKGDYKRLAVVYKTLNDLYYPKANIFYRYSDKVLSAEMEKMMADVYGNDDIKALTDRRNELIEQKRDVESDIADAQLNISYYTDSIARSRSLLNSKRGDYEQAKNSKPDKPSFLANMLTFGSANSKYNRDVYDWHRVCGPVIAEYENYIVDVDMMEEDLKTQNETLSESKQRMADIKMELKKLSDDISGKLLVSDDIKAKMLTHLNDILKLLRIAKDILESKLDEKYMKTISISDYRNTELPEDMQQAISGFANVVRENLDANALVPQQLMDAPAAEDQQADHAALSMAQSLSSSALASSVNAVEEMARLTALKRQAAITAKEYDEQLAKIQSAFDADMSAVDRQAAQLQTIMAAINTAKDPEALKEAMLLLGSGSSVLDKSSFDDFLKGNKTIEI